MIQQYTEKPRSRQRSIQRFVQIETWPWRSFRIGPAHAWYDLFSDEFHDINAGLVVGIGDPTAASIDLSTPVEGFRTGAFGQT